jgi:hypothetical protein
MVPRLQLVDREGDDQSTRTGACFRDHPRDGAQRSATDCERSRRDVG